VPKVGFDSFVEHNIRVDQKKPVDSLRPDEIPQREILLMAEEDPGVLVVREKFVGKQLGEFPRFLEVVLVTVVFDPKVEAVAAITEQDETTPGIRTPSLRDGVGQVKAVPAVDQDDGRGRHDKK
jgi:hypothetical protein